MREALWIHANIEGRARWYIAIDRGGSVYFPEIDFEEDMDLETYQTEFPHSKVRAIPTVEEWENLCAAYDRTAEKMISPLLTRREPFNSRETVNGSSLIEAAAAARSLLSKLSGRLEIDEELHAEVSRTEDSLWAALFPGAQPGSAPALGAG